MEKFIKDEGFFVKCPKCKRVSYAYETSDYQEKFGEAPSRESCLCGNEIDNLQRISHEEAEKILPIGSTYSVLCWTTKE